MPPGDWTLEQRQPLFRQAEELIFNAGPLGRQNQRRKGLGRAKKRTFLERVGAGTPDLFKAIKSLFNPQGHMSRGCALLPPPRPAGQIAGPV